MLYLVHFIPTHMNAQTFINVLCETKAIAMCMILMNVWGHLGVYIFLIM